MNYGQIPYGRRSGQQRPQQEPLQPQPDDDGPMDLAGTVISKLRAAIVKRGGSDSIASISRRFRIMERKGSGQNDGKLTEEELYYSMKDIGISLCKQEAKLILCSIDTNNSGDVCFDEFLFALRGRTMSQPRKAVVDRAFSVFDPNGDGAVSLQEVMKAYNVDQHPDYLAGKKTKNQICQTFMQMFDDSGDGIVTRKEFRDYYRSVSASMDSDDTFIQVVTNAWNLDGRMVGAGPLKNNRVGAALEVKVGNGGGAMPNFGGGPKLKVMCQFVDGETREVTVENDAGLSRNPLDFRAIKQRLVKQGVHGIAKISSLNAGPF